MIDQLRDVIHQIEHEWSHKRLLVIGDVMLDKYIWGEVGRISPEAPVPIVRTTHESHQPGGAANVAMNLAHLGAQAHVIGFAGADENRKLLAESLRFNRIAVTLIASDDFPTITKQRIMCGRQQMLRLDSERNDTRPQKDYDGLVQAALALIPNCDVLILSDYAKGVLTPEVCQSVIQAARRLDIPVLIDPKSSDFSRYRGATTICPNLNELSKATQNDTGDLNALLDASKAMVTNLDLEFLTATLSEKGIAVVRPDSRFFAPAVAKQVFDVSGAGDTVISVLALCLGCALKPEISIQLANVAAGIVVGKVGTVPVAKHELLAALSMEIALHAEDKVVSNEELAVRTAVWRANGERIVFTNGCFDLLHVGHITVLEQARSFGDRLIVAINSDESVSRLKGSSRPVVDEGARARVLAALTAVDAVVVFGELTPLNIIKAVKPNVIVKGGDYNPETVVGSHEVQSWGGEVKIIPIVQGYSTTRLIEKAH